MLDLVSGRDLFFDLWSCLILSSYKEREERERGKRKQRSRGGRGEKEARAEREERGKRERVRMRGERGQKLPVSLYGTSLIHEESTLMT